MLNPWAAKETQIYSLLCAIRKKKSIFSQGSTGLCAEMSSQHIIKKQVNHQAIKGCAFFGEWHPCGLRGHGSPGRTWENQSCTHAWPCSALGPACAEAAGLLTPAFVPPFKVH